MELDGLDALLARFERMERDIEDDVSTIVRNNTIEMTKGTTRNAVFDKGYQTGYTKRGIETQKVNSLKYKTVSKSEHSGFLEWGTRFMDAQPFLYPAFFKQKPKFLADLKRLTE